MQVQVLFPAPNSVVLRFFKCRKTTLFFPLVGFMCKDGILLLQMNAADRRGDLLCFDEKRKTCIIKKHSGWDHGAIATAYIDP